MWKTWLAFFVTRVLVVDKFSTVENSFSTARGVFRAVENPTHTFHSVSPNLRRSCQSRRETSVSCFSSWATLAAACRTVV